jgi:hypothetical protein
MAEVQSKSMINGKKVPVTNEQQVGSRRRLSGDF